VHQGRAPASASRRLRRADALPIHIELDVTLDAQYSLSKKSAGGAAACCSAALRGRQHGGADTDAAPWMRVRRDDDGAIRPCDPPFAVFIA